MVFEASRGAHVEGEEMKQNEMFVRTKEEVKESARIDGLKKKERRRRLRGKGYRFQASYLRAEDVWVWTLRTSSFSLAEVWRGGGVGH